MGESTEDTARRELAEETGLKATVGSVLGVFSRWFTENESVLGGTGHAVGVVHEATDTEGQLRTSFDEGTTDAARWFTVEEVQTLPRVELVDFMLRLI